MNPMAGLALSFLRYRFHSQRFLLKNEVDPLAL
jgi:hypothetical protein